MSFEVRPLAPEHAVAAAAIHAEGQEHTFLTSLGQAFLRALYAGMASSAHCFGYVALDMGSHVGLPQHVGQPQGGQQVIGVVTGTVDSGAVFKDLILRRGLRLILPVAGAMLRHPSLVPKVFKTALYPAQTKGSAGEAELLFIGTRADRRGEGVGRALFHALAEEMRRRGMRVMGLTVDDDNESAKRFYLHNGMRPARAGAVTRGGPYFTLYGRRMQWFVLPLRDEGGIDDGRSVG